MDSANVARFPRILKMNANVADLVSPSAPNESVTAPSSIPKLDAIEPKKDNPMDLRRREAARAAGKRKYERNKAKLLLARETGGEIPHYFVKHQANAREWYHRTGKVKRAAERAAKEALDAKWLASPEYAEAELLRAESERLFAEAEHLRLGWMHREDTTIAAR